MQHDAIAVVDFGGQYAHLIATKVRRLRVHAEIRQPEDPLERFEGFRGIILSGSPSLASCGEGEDFNRTILDLPIPILGFCYGHQEIAKHYGGTVIHGGREWGAARLYRAGEPHPLLEGVPEGDQVFQSHFDSVVAVGPTFREIGWTRLGEDGEPHRFAAIASDALRRYGFQFHPEVDDSLHGDRMIANFVLGICGCKPTWTPEAWRADLVQDLRRRIGTRSVFLLVSGGVDSTVCARLLGEVVGPDGLHLLHIDNGLMRKGESAQVLRLFEDLGLGHHLHFVDASEDFLQALEGLVEPEAKRRAIGDTFVRVFEREARRLGIQDHLLGQGTIYPDTIETGGTRRADLIKTHHNRVPVIEEMIAAGRVVEPLADLYKVEVRELGATLGLPREALWRHPFPGPGLGVRLLCSTGEAPREDLDPLQQAAGRIAAARGLRATVLPVRSVGVKADLRCYEHPVVVHGEAPWEVLQETMGAMMKEVPGLNRCVWNLGPQEFRQARPLPARVTRDRLDLLREADALVMEGLRRHGVHDAIWQCPTVLVPLEVDGTGRELVVVRPIRSERAMTATAAPLPAALLGELRASLLALPGVSGLVLDLTSKPPGTIEWE
ncbi:MAG TPA: glutamine-hydrolyzing GMP synthase [Myxococcota bacterium]|nr:glutamine-hydrolyzing GMP synthase [Myxococcota bacterium]HQK50240.1 glutamine-hydrolyzing GMP synthase [Myxococcota bacterium]